MFFTSIYRHGFARVAACTSKISLADPAANAEAILRLIRVCDGRGVALLVLPELALSGYSIDDLLLQDTLLDGVERGIGKIVGETKDLLPLTLFGAPLRHGGRIYNCAVAVPNGPKVSAGGSLSPRGDWRAPSDGNARIWLEELEENVPD